MQTQKEQEDMVFTTTQLLHLDSRSDSSAAATVLGMYCCLLMSHDTRKPDIFQPGIDGFPDVLAIPSKIILRASKLNQNQSRLGLTQTGL